MIIEMFGFCGAGKSTLAARLAPALAERLRTTSETHIKESRGVPELLADHPLAGLSAAVRAVRAPETVLSRSGRQLLLARLRHDSIAARVPQGHVQLLDEGYLQRAWALLATGQPVTTRGLEALLPARRMLCLSLRVPSAEVQRRIRLKPDPVHLNAVLADAPLGGAAWRRAEVARDDVLAALRRRQVAVVEVDNTGEVDVVELAARLSAAVH